MDQTAEVNPGSVPNPIPNIAPQTSMPSSGKPKMIIYFVVIILAAVLGIGGYFIGAYVQSKKVPVSTTVQEAVIPAGFTKAQELIDAGGNLVVKSEIQVSYNGALTVVDSGKSWTLKKGAKTVTIRQEGNQEVKYSRIPAPNAPAQPVKASDLKIGDGIVLLALVDTKTGAMSVTNIIITPNSGTQATPSATPATPKP